MCVFMKLAGNDHEISHNVVKSIPRAAGVKVVALKSSLSRQTPKNGTTSNIKEYSNGDHEISHHVVKFIPRSCRCIGCGPEVIVILSFT